MNILIHVILSLVLSVASPITAFILVIPILERYSALQAVFLILGTLSIAFALPFLIFKYVFKAKCPDCQNKMKRTGIDKVKYTCDSCDKTIKLPEIGKAGKLLK